MEDVSLYCYFGCRLLFKNKSFEIVINSKLLNGCLLIVLQLLLVI